MIEYVYAYGYTYDEKGSINGVSISLKEKKNKPDKTLENILKDKSDETQENVLENKPKTLENILREIFEIKCQDEKFEISKLEKCFLVGEKIGDEDLKKLAKYLSQFKKLWELDVSNTSIGNISPLYDIKLWRLNISHTQISDISPLIKCTKLWELNAVTHQS
ncbi:hypothetical protein [Wolbachia endosymbiont of Ctenocephalides felis wCfeT]|uniref:hypothetical protein n=1 Tax=Wolbachia endosymbiont of Ctenocephalides felis wCfeT TaxID=2732593 RepID=UPI00144517CF|nr:hypothetical protein [Wolbachia endosymbiont of Ctenocephalides felis wCfeT]